MRTLKNALVESNKDGIDTVPIRLQKLLSEAGIMSRRAVEELIIARKVKINGKIAMLGDKALRTDTITISGKKLVFTDNKPVVYMYFKPAGIESTMRTGSDTLASLPIPERVYGVGRLDKESRGMLLLTSDGELCNRLTHPKYAHEKEYQVAVDKGIDDTLKRAFQNGVEISGKRTQPASIKVLGHHKFSVVLKEGRNRQIRITCGRANFTVKDLLRTRIAFLTLDNIKEGEYRKLSDEEYDMLKKTVIMQ